MSKLTVDNFDAFLKLTYTHILATGGDWEEQTHKELLVVFGVNNHSKFVVKCQGGLRHEGYNLREAIEKYNEL